MPIAKCKLCLGDGPLVKAHIIPKPFWKLGRGTHILRSSIPGEFAKRARIGVYDKGILCGSCDGKLGILDNYGRKTLLRDFDKVCLNKGERVAGIFYHVDYAPLKLFFLSVLWRASVGSQPFFNRVELGSHQKRLLEMIRAEDPGPPDEFAVILIKLEGGPSKAILSPSRWPFENVNYYKLYMGGYVAHIKVDNHATNECLREIMLRPNSLLYVILDDLLASREYEVMKRIVKISTKSKR